MPAAGAVVVLPFLAVGSVVGKMNEPPHPGPFAFEQWPAILADCPNDGGVNRCAALVAIDDQIACRRLFDCDVSILVQDRINDMVRNEIAAAGKNPAMTIGIAV